MSEHTIKVAQWNQKNITNLKLLNKHFDLPSFHGFPDVSWKVEHGGLQIEYKTDPLVIFVILHFTLKNNNDLSHCVNCCSD